jgi:hypothetical protein
VNIAEFIALSVVAVACVGLFVIMRIPQLLRRRTDEARLRGSWMPGPDVQSAAAFEIRWGSFGEERH